MANKSVITYIQPKTKFIMVGKGIISKFNPEVVGTYCKIIQLSGGISLSIPFIAEKIDVSVKRVRRVIVILEEAGYVVRKPIKDERGAFSGWNYCVLAEPVSKNERSHAGRKSDLNDSGLDRERTYPKTDKSETGKENILSDTNVSSNNEDFNSNKKKVLSDDNTKNEPISKLSDEERLYEEKMKERFPHIMRMVEPLTLKQAKELKERYDPDLLAQIMDAMENWRPLIKQNVSAYKTIIKWCDKENNKL